MIPLTDVSRRATTFPIATLWIIVINLVVFVIELMNGDAFVLKWSLVPANISAGHDLVTIFTSMFLHGSWSHIIGNMVFLWAFGPQIEDEMGAVRYSVFYLMGGLAASLAQLAVDPHSTVPNLGASGAIAAVMGAFLVTFPKDQIRSVLFLGIFFRITYVPAALLIGVWFLLQLFDAGSVIAQPAAASQSGGVAYLAHVGGLLFGALFGHFFEARKPIVAEV